MITLVPGPDKIAKMSFTRLVRFESDEEGSPSYFADIALDGDGPPPPGTKLGAFRSVDDLINKIGEKVVTVKRVIDICLIHRPLVEVCAELHLSNKPNQQLLAPLPHDGIPIYCVGLNYRSHAKEANVGVPQDETRLRKSD